MNSCYYFLHCLIAIILSEASASHHKLRKIASFPFKNPAFVTAHENPLQPGSLDLIISTFGVDFFGQNPDSVHYIPNIGEALKSKNFNHQRVSRPVTWPNEVNLIDQQHLVVAGGFLVPGKKGHISAIDYVKFRESNGQNVEWEKLIDEDNGFYHRVEKVNIFNRAAKEGDDGERMVSCRGRKGFFDGGSGEMVYLEKNDKGEYEQHVIEHGCDCFFTAIDLNGDGIVEFIVPAFFGKKVFLMWTEHPLGDYSQREYVRQRVIDDSIGSAFDLQHVDLDGDGIQEIIVTNHESGRDRVKPSLYAYKIHKPETQRVPYMRFMPKDGNDLPRALEVTDFMENLQFERFTISSNFSVVNWSFMAAAPGGAQTAFPTSDENGRPVIVVSGDGSEKAYLLQARTPTSSLEDYIQEDIHDCKGTVGGILVKDIDGDGIKEVIIPCYDTHSVEVYTFKQ